MFASCDRLTGAVFSMVSWPTETRLEPTGATPRMVEPVTMMSSEPCAGSSTGVGLAGRSASACCAAASVAGVDGVVGVVVCAGAVCAAAPPVNTIAKAMAVADAAMLRNSDFRIPLPFFYPWIISYMIARSSFRPGWGPSSTLVGEFGTGSDRAFANCGMMASVARDGPHGPEHRLRACRSNLFGDGPDWTGSGGLRGKRSNSTTARPSRRRG